MTKKKEHRMVEHNHKIASDQERMKALIENISAYIEQYQLLCQQKI